MKMKHPIRMQVSANIKAAKALRLRWWIILSLMVFSFIACAVFDHFGRLNMTLPVLDCAFMFAFFIYLKRALRRQAVFWMTIAVLAMIHASLIWYIPWGSKWVPAGVIAGILSLDLCLMLWVLAAVEVLLGGQTAAELKRR